MKLDIPPVTDNHGEGTMCTDHRPLLNRTGGLGCSELPSGLRAEPWGAGGFRAKSPDATETLHLAIPENRPKYMLVVYPFLCTVTVNTVIGKIHSQRISSIII